MQQSTNDDDDFHRLQNTLSNASVIKAKCGMPHLGVANMAINNFLLILFFSLIRCCLLSCSLVFNIYYIKQDRIFSVACEMSMILGSHICLDPKQLESQ
jgi:hypothetical protein